MSKIVEVTWMHMEKNYLFLEERQSLLYLMFMKEKLIYIDYVFKGILFDVVAQKKQEQKQKEEQRKQFEETQKRRKEEQKKREEANQNQADEIEKNGYKFLENETEFTQGRNVVEKFKKKVPIKETEQPYIKAFVKRVFDANDRDWKNFKAKNWKKVISWLDKPTAQQWFSEIAGK